MLDFLGEIAKVVTGAISSLGYWGIFWGMAIESANIPLPSEVILPYGGYLVSTGRLEFYLAVMAGTLGGTLGSVISYWLGICGGRPLLVKYGHYFGFSVKHLETAERWFDRYGEATVFFTRLMPVVRTFISLPAGIARMNFVKFVIYTFLGSLPWSLLLTYAGLKLGENWNTIESWFHKVDVFILAGLAIVLLCFLSKRCKKRFWVR